MESKDNAAMKITGLTTILGAAWSGKTSLAFKQLQSCSNIVQMSTWLGTADLTIDYIRQDVQQLQDRFPSSWRIIDEPVNLSHRLKSVSAEKCAICVDSMSTWIANLIATKDNRRDRLTIESEIESECDTVVAQLDLMKSNRVIIVVSAEMGACPPPNDPETYLLRKMVSVVNQKLAEISQTVFYTRAGLVEILKQT